jgi:iron complex transport system substrate-binding protein
MRKATLLAVVLWALAALTGCNKNSAREPAEPAAYGEIRTIISSAPSNTEIILGLGLGDKLIAVDRYSGAIPGVPADAALIDFFYPDTEALIKLAPDIIFAGEHNTTGSGDDPFKLLSDSGIRVAYIPTSSSIEGIYGDIAAIAEILSVREKGDELARAMRAQVELVASIGRTIAEKKSVYFELSSTPNLVSFGRGTFLHEMISVIGAENIFGDRSGWISVGEESVIQKDPDVILTNDAYVDDPVGIIKNRVVFSDIKAVKNNAIYRIDANSSSRPSQHILLALKQMAQAVYPDRYSHL